ncbi:MAG: DUF4249 family protein [Bacteroidales bacterium]|nr:DUF4249 family protein [Bacteroidales bacterium]
MNDKTTYTEDTSGNDKNRKDSGRLSGFFSSILALLLMLLGLNACEEQTDWDLQTVPSDMIVVESVITNEMKQQSVKITFPQEGYNDSVLPVRGAEVIVTVNGNVYNFKESPDQPGIYLSNVPFEGKPGKEHSLLISYGNKVFTAKSGMVNWQGNFGEGIYVTRKDDNLYRLVWLSRPYHPKKALMYELLIDWSHLPAWKDSSWSSTHARMFYYTLPTLDVSEIFAPAIEAVRFPLGTKITERRYTLTPQHADFVRDLLSETTWQGGYFSSAPSNVGTNLSSGAIGYFGACAVLSNTSVVNGLISKSTLTDTEQ